VGYGGGTPAFHVEYAMLRATMKFKCHLERQWLRHGDGCDDSQLKQRSAGTATVVQGSMSTRMAAAKRQPSQPRSLDFISLPCHWCSERPGPPLRPPPLASPRAPPAERAPTSLPPSTSTSTSTSTPCLPLGLPVACAALAASADAAASAAARGERATAAAAAAAEVAAGPDTAVIMACSFCEG
jgi:hypothetical protein